MGYDSLTLRSWSFGPPRFITEAPSHTAGVTCMAAPASIPKPPAWKSSIPCWTNLKFTPSASDGESNFEAVTK